MLIKLLLLMLCIDIIFIVGDIISHYFLFTNPGYSPLRYTNYYVDSDGGYPEFFQYLKFLIICTVLFLTMVRTKNYSFIFWILLFFLLFLDDAFSFHEGMGEVFAGMFDLPSFAGLRPVDIGELLYYISVGGALGAVGLLCYHYGNVFFKNASIDLGLLFGILLFFAVFMDVAHGMLAFHKFLGYLFVLLEDGGEMVALSLITWYAVHLSNSGPRPAYLFSYFTSDRYGFWGYRLYNSCYTYITQRALKEIN